MKSWRIVTVLLLCLVLAGATACNPFADDEQETSQQLVEVVRGDLMVSVSGSGSIEVSDELRLAFGVGGRIDKIYVEEGDKVSEGDVLAKLDTGALELALIQAQVAQTQAQVALQTAEYNLEQTQLTYTLSDIKVAQADVDEAARDLEEALRKLYKYDPGTPGWEEYQKIVTQAGLRLNTAEDKLDAMLSGTDTEEVAIKKLQVEAAQQSLEVAQQSLEVAQKQLDKATITASFDGVVASVGADEGDTVLTTTTIIHLIDLTSMELKVDVDEIDVAEVKPGQRAIIEVDALPDLPLEGEVTFISPVAKEEAGVVLYEVKINFGVPEGSGLRVGMSATADIILAQRSNVLLVPNRAISQDSQGNLVVKVMVDEEIEERPVVIGISDGVDTEIVYGLSEGETVVIER